MKSFGASLLFFIVIICVVHLNSSLTVNNELKRTARALSECRQNDGICIPDSRDCPGVSMAVGLVCDQIDFKCCLGLRANGKLKKKAKKKAAKKKAAKKKAAKKKAAKKKVAKKIAKKAIAG